MTAKSTDRNLDHTNKGWFWKPIPRYWWRLLVMVLLFLLSRLFLAYTRGIGLFCTPWYNDDDGALMIAIIVSPSKIFANNGGKFCSELILKNQIQGKTSNEANRMKILNLKTSNVSYKVKAKQCFSTYIFIFYYWQLSFEILRKRTCRSLELNNFFQYQVEKRC